MSKKMAWHRLQWCMKMLRSKSGRMIIMLILTVGIAIAEIVYGIRSRSQLLIADGLFSFAEGIALVGSLLALRYAKVERLHEKNTFGWARLELLAGLLQEVLLLSLSLTIIIDAINKLINPNHIEDATPMIYLGIAGFCIGLLGLLLFHGYHHDHNIQNEIVEQKKNDFVQSVCNTLKTIETKQNEMTNEQKNHFLKHDIIIDDTSIPTESNHRKSFDFNEHQLRVPDKISIESNRMRSQSGESVISSIAMMNDEDVQLENDFEDTRVYATLHALCLHSFAVLLESAIVLFTGLLNKYIPNKDQKTQQPINTWLKYIDPALTLLMVIVISIKAIPVIWSLGHILVEAVPSGINTHQLIDTIMKTIPQIRAVHSVHVWRATARDIFATLHVVCNEDLSLSICRDLFHRRLQRIFRTHCIRYYTLQFEYVRPGEDINKCVYSSRRRHRGHQSTSDDTCNFVQSQMDLQVDHIIINSIGEYV